MINICAYFFPKMTIQLSIPANCRISCVLCFRDIISIDKFFLNTILLGSLVIREMCLHIRYLNKRVLKMLRNDQWIKLETRLPTKAGDRGATAQNDHLFLGAVLWVVRTGSLTLARLACTAVQLLIVSQPRPCLHLDRLVVNSSYGDADQVSTISNPDH